MANELESCIVISGSFSVGFQIYGPFGNYKTASQWIVKNSKNLEETNEILTIQTKEEIEKEWKGEIKK